MKKFMFMVLLVALLCFSCMSNLGRGFKIKKSYKPSSISENYANGNYYSAFRQAAEILRKNKSEKDRNTALSIIEESYVKSLEKEKQNVEDKIKYLQDEIDYEFLKLEHNETNL